MLPPVEAQRVRADAGCQRRQVEELLVQAADLEEEPAPRIVPVKGEVAGLGVHAARVVGDGGEAVVGRG